MAHKGSGEKLIASNPHARSNFFVDEIVEAGMVLTGTEVKSLRAASPNMRDAFVDVHQSGSKLEAHLLNLHIAPYTHGNIYNHEPLRKRKLLLHIHQLRKLLDATTTGGMTIIPLRMYFKEGRAKIEIATAKGKKKHDKRQDVKERSARREMDQAVKKSRR